MFEVFPYIFSTVFNTVANNREFIDNVVDSIMNNEAFNTLINNLENTDNISVDFKEYGKAYFMVAYLPGVSKSDIILDYTNNYITLEVKRNKYYSNNNGNSSMFAIISNGEDISKDFYVENINPYEIKAIFKNDILKVYMPKDDKRDKDTPIIEINEFN